MTCDRMEKRMVWSGGGLDRKGAGGSGCEANLCEVLRIFVWRKAGERTGLKLV